MARRNGRKGDYLATDDYTGFTVYASRLKKDYWGNMAVKPLLRNLQEIASPMDDPYPVLMYRGPAYEKVTACDFELQPLYIGNTTIPFPNTLVTQIMGLDPGIGEAAVGCTFRVH